MANPAMPYRRLPGAGLKLSALSLGGWTTFGSSVADQELIGRILRRAFDAGVNFFDIADAYARGDAERSMGAVLRELPRHELVISSKLFWPMSEDPNDRGLSRKHIKESIDKSLKRIGTDYLDLYFCHRFDDDTPLEETVRAMDDLVRAGKVLYWGTSEWSGAQLRRAHAIADKRNAYAPVVEQPHYSLIARHKLETDVLPAARDTEMGFVVWSPLGSGVLTGKYDDGIPPGSRLDRIEWLRKNLTDDVRAHVKEFANIANALGVSRARLALAWALARENVTSVIMGATTIAQLEENLSSLDVQVPDDVMARLDALFPAAPPPS
jgi:voltage-dependent potassium channel beta subunit